MLSIHGFPGGGCQDRTQLIFMAVVTGLDTAPTLESHLYIKCGFFIFFLRALTLLGSRKTFLRIFQLSRLQSLLVWRHTFFEILPFNTNSTLCIFRGCFQTLWYPVNAQIFQGALLALLPKTACGRMRAPAGSHGSQEEEGLGSAGLPLGLCSSGLHGFSGWLSGLKTAGTHWSFK